MLVKPGMTLHVRVALSGVHKEAGRGVVAIGDTVVIEQSGPLVVTAKTQKKYSEISYSLEDSDDGSNDQPEEEGSEEVMVAGRTGNSVIKSSRLRSKADQQQAAQTEAEDRKEHQMQLYAER